MKESSDSASERGLPLTWVYVIDELTKAPLGVCEKFQDAFEFQQEIRKTIPTAVMVEKPNPMLGTQGVHFFLAEVRAIETLLEAPNAEIKYGPVLYSILKRIISVTTAGRGTTAAEGGGETELGGPGGERQEA